MKIDDKLLDSLTEQAKSSERLRMNMDLRNSPADTSQRMLNAIEPGSVVPIHRHCTTSETVVMLRGRLIEEFYDDLECRCTDAIELSADGPVRALNIPAGQWHTVRVLESGTVIMEVKDGPYIPTSPTDILTLSSSESNQQASFITSSQPSVSPSDSAVRTSSCTSAHTSVCVSEQSVSNPTTCSTRCSSSEPNNIVSSDTSHQPSVSPSDASASLLDSNQPVSSTFIPAPDPRAFDGGDILRQKKKQ